MRVIGFNFIKLKGEKKKNSFKDLKISTHIDVLELKTIKADLLKTKEDILNAVFTYKVDYEPGIALIELEGNAVITLDPKEVKDILKQWKKKKLPEEFKIFLFNLILKKSTLRSLQLEEELNLPPHMPLPSFKKQNN